MAMCGNHRRRHGNGENIGNSSSKSEIGEGNGNEAESVSAAAMKPRRLAKVKEAAGGSIGGSGSIWLVLQRRWRA